MLNEIIYDYVNTPLGKMIVGIVEDRCCLLEFEDRYSLPRILIKKKLDYNAEFVEGFHPLIRKIEIELAEYFKGKLHNFTIEISARGTEFQENVWSELLNIPFGSTTTYGKIAKQINKPEASRGVGRANGANNIAIVIPCHRVVGESGDLIGYGGGKNRKKKLLELEGNYVKSNNLNKWF